MSVNKTIFGVTAGLVLLCAFLWYSFSSKNATLSNISSEVKIEKSWELPKVLSEVSGIAYLKDDKIAAVQDEEGIIFIYDLNSSKIVDEIKFAGTGDYEGIAIKSSTAFVVESDGKINEIQNFLTNPEVSEIETALTEAQDVEGLFYNEKNDELLLAVKEGKPNSQNHKDVYAFDLKNGVFEKNPVFKIDMNDGIFKEVEEKKPYNNFKPSEVNIHPKTGEIYMLEGQDPKLLILSEKGGPKQLYFLDKNKFPQPEGLTFDPSGTLYISNEGNPGTIHQVSIN